MAETVALLVARQAPVSMYLYSSCMLCQVLTKGKMLVRGCGQTALSSLLPAQQGQALKRVCQDISGGCLRGHVMTAANQGRCGLLPEHTMSCWGMPSVMQTTRGISASTDSRMAAAAKGGGT